MTAQAKEGLYAGVWMCVEPSCECTVDVIHTRKGPVIENALMRRGSEEIRLCLLCFLSRRNYYESEGFEFIKIEKPKE